ncbi:MULTISPECIES: CcmD family protein [Bacillaceae]|nr:MULTISPECIES: CcmD family protein [Bacillaceae]MDX8359502.1 CcmD family protein [Cytobacillus sp. IB215316]
MGYLFSAYTIAWVLIAGYVVMLGKRQRKLEKELDYIQELEKQ